MNESKFNVLLYLDESEPAYFAVAYSAILIMNMPNMHLTVVQLKESNDGSMETANNRLKSWPLSPTLDWMKDVLGGSEMALKTRYNEILTKTTEIFSKRVVDVSHQVIYCNPSIPDTVDALLEYARKNSTELIVMGSEELTTLKSLIYGRLEHSLQKRAPIPVLLVKKLPQDFLKNYQSKQNLKLIRK